MVDAKKILIYTDGQKFAVEGFFMFLKEVSCSIRLHLFQQRQKT